MNSNLNYILVIFLTIIITLRMIIDTITEVYFSKEKHDHKKNNYLSTVLDIKIVMDIISFLISLYLVFNTKFNLFLIILLFLILISLSLDVLIEKGFIYSFLNKKDLDNNTLQFFKYYDSELNIFYNFAILLVCWYILYRIF
jgi:hypothetical protein